MFPSRTALVKHLVSAEHRRLTVICPWCQGEEKTFTKISDLEVHVKGRHKDVDLPRDRFSRSCGFYFSMYPKDYGRIVDNIAPYNSDEAYDIRKAIREWAEKFTDGKERVMKWNDGWKKGIEMSEAKSRRSNERKKRDRREEIIPLKRSAESMERVDPKKAKTKDTFGYNDDITIEEATVPNNESAISRKDGILDESQETGTKDTRKKKVEIDDSTTKDVEPGTSISSSSDSSSDSETNLSQGSIKEGIRARAHRLLQRGAMPFCPPARRDWSAVSEFEIEYGGKGLSWPPSNWRALTPDQRLLAREHASTFLELRKSKEFPTLSRKAILDMYLFLGLDDEGRPKEEENEADRMETKIRQYNFAYLKGIATGLIADSKISWGIVKGLEKAERWTDTDTIIDKLDAWGIRIKL